MDDLIGQKSHPAYGFRYVPRLGVEPKGPPGRRERKRGVIKSRYEISTDEFYTKNDTKEKKQRKKKMGRKIPGAMEGTGGVTAKGGGGFSWKGSLKHAYTNLKSTLPGSTVAGNVRFEDTSHRNRNAGTDTVDKYLYTKRVTVTQNTEEGIS